MQYGARVASEGRASDERQAEMKLANPKYILRNWMAAQAYDAAAQGDVSLVRELHQVLLAPYDEQSAAVESRWARPTPEWARSKMGLAFMT